MDQSKIIQKTLQIVQERQAILGAKLGSMLLDSFPELRENPDYPGLKRFIQLHCFDRIIISRTSGGDDVYQFVRDGEVPAIIAATDIKPKAWEVFQHPLLKENLFIDTTNGWLLVSTTSEVETEIYKPVSKVTKEEHRAIAQEYLERIPVEARWEFQQALAGENYWPHWSKLVNKYPYRSSWKEFRFEKLCDLFKSRLRGHGMSDILVSTSLNQLLKEKKEQIHKEKGENAVSRQNFSIHADKPGVSSSLRSVIRAAIDAMDDAELRNLWLPLGEVLNALKRP